MILEDQNVAEADVLLEIEHPLAKRPQHALDLRLGHRRERLVVIRRLDDHFMRTDAVHAIEHALGLPLEAAFHFQRGELVRHDPKVPAGPVRGAAVLPVRQDLVRRELLTAGAERTVLGAQRGHTVDAEIARPLLTLGGDDHPPPSDGIFS